MPVVKEVDPVTKSRFSIEIQALRELICERFDEPQEE